MFFKAAKCPAKSISRSLFRFLPGIFFTGILASLQAQEHEVALLFQYTNPIHLEITMDMRTVLRDVGEDPSNHPAMLSYATEDGDSISLPLKIRPRGNFRKNPMNCNFPPLYLDFDKDSLQGTIFEGQNRIKLVTHCQNRNDLFEQNVLKEYLAYKMYNLITEESFMVRLVMITYKDKTGRRDPLVKPGFLIEPEEHMALRNDCELMDSKFVHQERTDRHKITVLSVFQYMIGNTDWNTRSEEGPHNIVLIREESGAFPVAVPYDFDWSGLVNAPYAEPAPNLPVNDVRTRLFRGYCRTESEFQAAFDEFLQRKEEIYRTVTEVPYLDSGVLSDIEKYIDDFFETLEDPSAVRKEFYEKCRNPE
jgi:hypothetical protein